MTDQTPEKRLTATEGRSQASQVKPRTKLVVSDAVKEIMLDLLQRKRESDQALRETEADRTSKPKRQTDEKG